MDIAKNFSAYFSNLAENLVRNLPIPWHIFDVLSVSQYCSHLRLDAKFDLLPKEKDYVLKILRDISTSKSVDILPGRFLKDGADVLAKPVPDICNLSISFNKFPSAFKWAKVKIIFIKGRKTNFSSYRYSLLAANTFEGHWKSCTRTNNFLNDNNIFFFKCQSGFRTNHSADLFLSFLNNKILKGFDNGVYWHDSDWPAKSILYDKPQNPAW